MKYLSTITCTKEGYMDRQSLIDEIRFSLTGGVLQLELDDEALGRVTDKALRELQRYITTTKFITIPYKPCIDMKEYKANSVSRVYRTRGYLAQENTGTEPVDPMLAQQWMLLNGNGGMYGMQDFTYNYAAWNEMLQIRSTTSTDLAFIYDKKGESLYINIANDIPTHITIEYVPRYDSVEEVVSDYWIDVLVKLSIAMTKVIVGRIRTRYTQSNALWANDTGILEEGINELKELREHLLENTQLVYPVD